MTPAGIEPAAFRFVAQYLNHCATATHIQVIVAANYGGTRHFSRATLASFLLSFTFTPSFATFKCVTSKERIRLHLVASDGTVSNIYKPPEQTRKKLYFPLDNT